MDEGFAGRFISAPDGLQLFVRVYGCLNEAVPVVCLPGLTRNGDDFHSLARHLSQDVVRPRYVVSIDSRGRGRSARDPDWRNYDINVEMADVLYVMEALSLPPVVVIGTSRGGLIAMAMASARPDAMRAAVLNDIGPVIETGGLVRIKSYAGRMPPPRTWQEAATILEGLFGSQFPLTTPDGWLQQARSTWSETAGGFVPNYDPAIGHGLDAIEPDMPSPTMWPLFDAMAGFPVMVIRGALSDLLSASTVTEMTRRHPDLKQEVVPDEGHPPQLGNPQLVGAIANFLAQIDIHPR